MTRKFLTVALITGSLMMAACNTVRGAARDMNSAANATSNAMHEASVSRVEAGHPALRAAALT